MSFGFELRKVLFVLSFDGLGARYSGEVTRQGETCLYDPEKCSGVVSKPFQNEFQSDPGLEIVEGHD